MYLESRRTFLKGAAFTVAGAAIAKGVFETDAVAESVTSTKFTNTPQNLAPTTDRALAAVRRPYRVGGDE